MICDFKNLRNGKCICEEGGRTLAIISRNIDLVEKKKSMFPVIFS